MPKVLSPASLERYARDGALFPLRVLPEAETVGLQRRYADFQATARRVLGAEQRFKVHLLAAWLEELVRLPRLLDCVEDVLGPDLLCWSTDFFSKPAASPGFVSLHQDSTYAGLEPPDGVVNAWLALTPSTEESGCLRVVPGSHRLGQLPHDNTRAPDNMLFFGQRAALPAAAPAPVPVVLAPGEASLHGMRLVHGSGPNRSGRPRIGLVIRYLRPDVRQSGPRDSALLVRGVDRCGHFDLEAGPDADFSPAACARFREALARPSGLGALAG